MKIKVTEIEASAEELRQSQSLSTAVVQAIRRSFIPAIMPEDKRTDDMEDEEAEVSGDE